MLRSPISVAVSTSPQMEQPKKNDHETVFSPLFSFLRCSYMSQEEVSQSSQVSFISQAERKNARFQRYMEDAHTIVPCLDGKKDVFFAGVYDGHGG